MAHNFAENDDPTRTIGLTEEKKENPCPFPLASLELLKKYAYRTRIMNGTKLNNPSQCGGYNPRSETELSTVRVMEIARAKFIHLFSQCSDEISMIICLFNGTQHCGLSAEAAEAVEHAVLLLATVEKVADKKFSCARKLINLYREWASPSGNSVQRVIHYFSEALQERIERETGLISQKRQECSETWLSDIQEAIASLKPSVLACGQELPFALVIEAAGIQVILDNMVSSKKIHLIDFEIKSGMHWTILMQALSVRYDCPIEILKITAIGTTAASKHIIEETGRRLSWFAEKMGLPFSFKIVMVTAIGDLNEDLFELEHGEAVAVYSLLFLKKLIGQPRQLETMLRLCKRLNPVLLVITEVEARSNSPVFMDRFFEVLTLYSAAFDALETCMGSSDPNRMDLESVYFRQGIQNVISFEGEKRKNWHMRIEDWRAFLKRFGIFETELGKSALCQAEMVLEKFACGSYCSLQMDGKCLLVGWKGTPIISLSAWKFQLQEEH